MTVYLIELHKKKPIATGEATSVLKQIDSNVKITNEEDFILAETNVVLPDLTKKLAFTQAIYEYICDFDNESIKNVNWKKYYKDNFAVRSVDKNVVDKLAKSIWDGVDDPKVKLDNSDMEVSMFFNKVFVLRQTILKELFNRENQKRPMKSSMTLSPSIAMAMVNLTKGETVYDPFCGMGGMLLEAAVLGRKTIGSDLSYSMVKATEINMKHFGFKDVDVFRADAMKHVLEKKADAIVCDVPYGHASGLFGHTREDLYVGFLNNLPNLLKKGGDLVFIMPSKVDYKGIIKSCGYEIYEEYSEYMHATLTRHIIHIVL
ncbi:MAG: methyltransferase domain-containing protein [Candidatus Woesearchaeota archaeon]|jgi:tRNA (guanine10-N2)-dimethyltransferase